MRSKLGQKTIMTTVEKENQVQMPNTIVKKNNIKEHSEPAVQENEAMEEIPDAQKEQLEEGAEDQEEDQEEDSVQEISLEEANALFAAGTQALALSNYEEAAEKLSIAVEAQYDNIIQFSLINLIKFYTELIIMVSMQLKLLQRSICMENRFCLLPSRKMEFWEIKSSLLRLVELILHLQVS